MSKFVGFLLILCIVVGESVPLVEERNVGIDCIISDYSQVTSVVKNKTCTNILVDNLAVPAGESLELSLKQGVSLSFKGTISFGYGTEWEGPLLKIKGKNINVSGQPGSVLDGQGAHYWDGKGDKGTKKPKFFKITATNGSVFKDINILNCPRQCVSVRQSADLIVSNFNIDVSDGDKDSLGHNTDGFDVSESDTVIFEDCVVKNQDDCVAINSGRNLLFSRFTCSGGHGLSFSIGQSTTDSSKNYAENITIRDSTVTNSRNGIHVKTHINAAEGYIKDITYSNIELSGITYFGINVQEDYGNGGSTGRPASNIPISRLNINNVKGTMVGPNSVPVYIICGSTGCFDFTWSDISITGAQNQGSCNFAPSGFPCT